MGAVDGIVLSHGHWDHGGAMLRALEMIIPETVDAMRAFNLKTIAAGHCTGWRAIGALTSAFGHAVVPSAVGKTFRL